MYLQVDEAVKQVEALQTSFMAQNAIPTTRVTSSN
jgi:hypothetical protein